jgi:hypothetical protein
MPTEVRDEGTAGAPRTGAPTAAGRPGRRLKAVAGGSNGSNRGVGAPFSTRRFFFLRHLLFE